MRSCSPGCDFPRAALNLEFHPAVQRDVNEILAFYEKDASRALAERFFGAMQARLTEIAPQRSRFSAWPPEPRWQRAFIPSFPHVILFEMREGRPRILVIKHQQQHPRRGLARH
jgi:plasmid stabilization system protein ParE